MSYNKETGMYEGYIYKIYNDVNDRIYIGQTAIDIESRWKQHLTKTAYREDNSIIHKAIEKYGKEHFNIKVVDTIYEKDFELLRTSLNAKEVYWIEKYNSLSPNGYNILQGGGYVPIRRTKIYQFDLCGNFIQEFESISDALRYLNISTKSMQIQSSIKRTRSAFGYLWSYDKNDNPYQRYKENLDKKGKLIISSNGKEKGVPVNQYNTNDVFIAFFDNMLSGALSCGKNSQTGILSCCRKKAKTSFGYKWYYADDPEQPDKTKILKIS